MSENNNKDLGKKTHIELAGGPKKDRGCTDILCFLILLAFGAACGYIAVFAFQNGDPSLLAQPYDPDHKPCGVGDLSDYPYIYFAAPMPTTLYRTVCLKTCPTADDDELNCSTNSVVTSCDQNLSPLSADDRTLVYDTVGYGGVICLPKVSQYIKKISSAIDVGQADQALSDLQNTWMIITGSGIVAILIGFLFLFLIRISAGCVVWSFILFFISGLSGGAYYFYTQYQTHLAAKNSSGTSDEQAKNMADEIWVDPDTYKYLAITFASLAAISILIICCMLSRIKLCIAVIKCSARFVNDSKSMLFVPVVFFLLTFAFVVYWIGVASYLYSCGTITDQPKSLPFAQFEYSDQVTYFSYAHLFSLLWATAFLVAACQFVIIGACSYWYYQGQTHSSHTAKAVSLFLRYHIGTVAFGSIIIAIIESIRIVLAYIDREVKQAGGRDNQCVLYFLRCMECFLMCFERFIKFLNKNAYIQTVMTGNSFCTASKDAFLLILRNPLRISLVSGFGELFEYLGNFAIMIATTFIGYLVLTNHEYYTEKLHSPIYPTVCFALISYMVGNFFMSLFGTGADCIIILFCMDEEMHTDAKFEPEELRQFRDDHDQCMHK